MAATSYAMLFPLLGAGVFFLFLLGIIGLVVYALRGNKNQQETSENETRMMQELHMGLKRMEKRVETLETILIDQLKK